MMTLSFGLVCRTSATQRKVKLAIDRGRDHGEVEAARRIESAFDEAKIFLDGLEILSNNRRMANWIFSVFIDEWIF